MNILLTSSKLTTKHYCPFLYSSCFYCHHYSNTLWVKRTCSISFIDCVHLMQRFYQDIEKGGFSKNMVTIKTWTVQKRAIMFRS
jgi:hypothetical protein